MATDIQWGHTNLHQVELTAETRPDEPASPYPSDGNRVYRSELMALRYPGTDIGPSTASGVTQSTLQLDGTNKLRKRPMLESVSTAVPTAQKRVYESEDKLMILGKSIQPNVFVKLNVRTQYLAFRKRATR